MKKGRAIILAVTLALSFSALLTLTGCGGREKDLEDRLNDLEDKLDAVTEAEPTEPPEEKPTEPPEEKPAEVPEEPAEAEPTDAPEEPEPTQAPEEEAPADDEIRPEIKEAIDSYVEFFREYAEFMKNYDSTDLSALSGYLSFMQQYTETMQKLDDMENEDLTDAETYYFAQAMLQIDQLLLEAVK